MIRQWYAGGVLTALLMAAGLTWATLLMLKMCAEKGWPLGGMIVLSIPLLGVLGFLAFVFVFGRKEFFGWTHYPIRFNRRALKIYALVRPSTRNAAGKNASTVEEIDWSENSFFCVHRASDDGFHYWIQYYKIDSKGLIEKTVTIGRDWEGEEGLQELLAQWNYWCWFMKFGPDELPKPCLYLTEKETIMESFLYCVYEIDFNASPAFRIAGMPVFLLLAAYRVIALWTCSAPRWPSVIADACKIEPNDPYNEPRGPTPVGWYDTSTAISKGKYPVVKPVKIFQWQGECDAKRNAQLWARDVYEPKYPVGN
ncbi:DUF6708 domain-containing protein [Pseudoduganella lutea]|uniref:DUF6708 domain-containing protein n=1 Tax=Pseudoduganella lutea TaxID=321985 RepID=A0A4P6KUH4_9BURK|nr:DUF6708 domain-containing protein [Pseudoduganella lutea]QBE62731.1 hypothetical protein EWM63_06900 [Pseudoduganella lutea]